MKLIILIIVIIFITSCIQSGSEIGNPLELKDSLDTTKQKDHHD